MHGVSPAHGAGLPTRIPRVRPGKPGGQPRAARPTAAPVPMLLGVR